METGLSADTVKEIKGVFEKYPQVESVILYGSRAKGTYKNGSDIDLTLIGAELDLHVLNTIANDMDDLLTPYKFDLSIHSDIDNKELLDHISRVGIEFYES